MVAAVQLEESVTDLHITAARKLQELIQTVQDPQLLSRLIATAFRFKLPKRPAPGTAPSTSSTHSAPSTHSTHSTPSSPSPRLSLTPRDDDAPAPASQPPAPLDPPFVPEDTMPYPQYELLHKQLGAEEARKRQREYRLQHRAERLARAAAQNQTHPPAPPASRPPA